MSKPLQPLSLPPFDVEFRGMQEAAELLQRQIHASLGIPAHYFLPPLNIHSLNGLPEGMALLVYKGRIEAVVFNIGDQGGETE